MRPRVYAPGTTSFQNRGKGTVSDAASCYVTEERNGVFELELTVPLTSKRFPDLVSRAIILAKPNPYDKPQPFFIWDSTKPMKGLVTFKARHISYDTDGLPVNPFVAVNAAQAMQMLNTQPVVPSPFTFSTDLTTIANMPVPKPVTIRKLMGGSRGGVLDTYGGEYAYDGYNIQLLQARGENRGVKFLYGKNLVDLRQEENINAVYTGVLPYWYNDTDGLVQGTPQYAAGSFSFVRLFPLDLTDSFESKPTVAQVNAAGAAYITENAIGVPTVSLSVRVVPPGSSGIQSLEEVHLCDTVTVRFDRLGIDTQAKVVKTRYDVLRDRYAEIELGDKRTSIADTIAAIEQKVAGMPTTASMQQAILSMTAVILGANGGAVRLLDVNGDGLLDTLYIADDPDPSTAQKVWRFNYEGWGASTNGFNGPFVLGATFENGGTINANNINVTNINGQNIKDATIGSAPLASGAVTEAKIDSSAVTTAKIGSSAVTTAKINGEAVTTAKLGSESVTNGKIGSSAVSYGKTSFTGTLDQVGVNQSNIAAINALFTSTLHTSVVWINSDLYYQNHKIALVNGTMTAVT